MVEELGIPPELIYLWRTELKRFGNCSFRRNGSSIMTSQEAEHFRLKKELANVRMQSDILKRI